MFCKLAAAQNESSAKADGLTGWNISLLLAGWDMTVSSKSQWCDFSGMGQDDERPGDPSGDSNLAYAATVSLSPLVTHSLPKLCQLLAHLADELVPPGKQGYLQTHRRMEVRTCTL